MKWLALDIGGANIKSADGEGYAQAYTFALWREPGLLAQHLRTAISEAPCPDHLLITMTGELADCFESKAAGVTYILDAVRDGAGNRHTRVYLTDGRMVTPQVAVTMPQWVAASNWHVLARFAGRFAAAGPALMIDIGSTTCDVIPLLDGKPVAKGTSDTERLLSGELVYTGIERSPVCAIADYVPYRGNNCPLVQEVFATTRDVYILTGDLEESRADNETADKRSATKAAARVRLGRMIAADSEEFNHRDAVAAAQALAEGQAVRLANAISKVAAQLPAAPTTIVLSGHGEFLARAALAVLDLKTRLVSLAEQLGPAITRSAPAHALATLAREAAGK